MSNKDKPMPDVLFVDSYESRPNHRKYITGEVYENGDTRYTKNGVPRDLVDALIYSLNRVALVQATNDGLAGVRKAIAAIQNHGETE